MEDYESPTARFYLIDGMSADLTAQVLDDSGRVLLRELSDNVLEEADDGMAGHAPWLDKALRLKYGLRRVIELEDGVVAGRDVIRHRVASSAPNSIITP